MKEIDAQGSRSSYLAASMTLPTANLLKDSGGRGTVLLHGMMLSPAIWTDTELVSQLDGRVVSYALPGHPSWELDEDGVRPLLGIRLLAEAYASAIERDFGGEPVDIVGHSTGGFLALLIAAYRPDLVRRLVVMSGFADGAMDARQPLAMRITRLPLVGSSAFVAGTGLGVSWPWLFATASVRAANMGLAELRRLPFYHDLERVRLGFKKCDLRALALFLQWLSSASLWADLDRVEAPVLMITGSRDRVVPVSHQLSLAGRLKRCRSLVLKGIGHLPMAEAEQSTARAIRAWLGDQGPNQPLDTELPKFSEIV